MSRHMDIQGWLLVLIAAALGLLGAWMNDSHFLSEDTARAGVYTALLFISLIMALRQAWRRLQFWVDLLILLVLHGAILLPTVRLLETYSIRLNWALALPFVMVEGLLALSLLWRRNVKKPLAEH